MSASVTALAEWIRTLGTTATTPDADSEPAADAQDDEASSLFQCSACQSVYVAAEKTTCGTCGTPVEQVASTHSTRD